MIDKEAILRGLVESNALVRVVKVDAEFMASDIKEEGGVVGNLGLDNDTGRYHVLDLDEDPQKLIVKILFPIEKLVAVFNLRYQPVLAILN